MSGCSHMNSSTARAFSVYSPAVGAPHEFVWMRAPASYACWNSRPSLTGRPYRPVSGGGQGVGTEIPAARSSPALFQCTSWSTAWKNTLASGATPAGTGASPASMADFRCLAPSR
jgi:hypothetical protein